MDHSDIIPIIFTFPFTYLHLTVNKFLTVHSLTSFFFCFAFVCAMCVHFWYSTMLQTWWGQGWGWGVFKKVSDGHFDFQGPEIDFISPPPLYKLRFCPSYSRRRDRINLGPNFNSVPNVVQPHKTWVW